MMLEDGELLLTPPTMWIRLWIEISSKSDNCDENDPNDDR